MDSLPSLPSVGQRCAYARKLAGFSQTEAARRIDRARGVIVEIEGDRRDASELYIEQLAEVYSVPAGWLRGEPGDWSRSRAEQSSEAVRWLVDVATYERVMLADRIDQVRAILAPSGREMVVIALPMAGARVVDWREAVALQDAARAHLRKLLEAEREEETGPGD